MRRWLVISVVTQAALLVWLVAAAPSVAGPAPTAGARPAMGSETGGAIRGQGATADAAPTFFQEITASFTAPPTSGGLGDALEASRATFSTTEPIEFDAVLNESGLAGTTANLQLFVFDPKGRLAVGGFFVNGIVAPSNRTGFFIQLNSGSVPAGRFTWLMVIFDAFGNAFVTPFQALHVQ